MTLVQEVLGSPVLPDSSESSLERKVSPEEAYMNDLQKNKSNALKEYSGLTSDRKKKNN